MPRIVAGRLGGRRIQSPPGRDTRPTAEKVRAAIFNVLQHRLDWTELRVLDLYSGSGALGIEALSRGAARACFVEAHRPVCRVIEGNLRNLGAEGGLVVPRRVEAFLKGPPPPGLGMADLVLLDPPYGYPALAEVLAALADWPPLQPGALVVLETGGEPPPAVPPRLESLLVKRYGDTQLVFHQVADRAVD